VGFLATTAAEACERLAEAAAALAGGDGTSARNADIHFRPRALDVSGRLVVLFPGQGSQSVDMGASLCASFPPFHEAYTKMDTTRSEHGQPPISAIVFPPPTFDPSERDAQAQRLRATNHAQAAIGAFNLGLFTLLRACGLAPDYVAGHSLGELAALHAGGALDERDYLSLHVARGEAMALPAPSGIDAGTLLAIGGDVAMIEDFVRGRPGITVANRNSRAQLVVAGSEDELATLKAELAALGVTATMLPVSGAFHSHRVAHAQAPFARAVEAARFSTPQIPTFANTTGAPYPVSVEAGRRLLAEQLVHPVEFRREIEAIHDAGGRIFVECGPGRALTGLVSNILGDRPHFALATNRTRGDDDGSLRDAYVQLRVAGVPLTDLDPWQVLPEVAEPKRGQAVPLNGAPYKSERTQLAFEQALQEGPEQTMTERETKSMFENTVTPTGDTSAEAHLRYLENMADYSNKYFDLTQRLFTLATSPSCSPAALASFERAISSFHEQQLTAQQVHTQFLQRQVEYTQRVVHASSKAAPLPGPPRRPAAPLAAVTSIEVVTAEPLARSGHEFAPEPARPSLAAPPAAWPEPPAPFVEPRAAHAPPVPLPSAVPSAVAMPAPPSVKLGPSPSLAAPTPAPNGSRSAERAEDIVSILLEVISEKTGYPLESLDASMDVDSDLGIDSLKRVEIMAALEGRLIKNLAGLDFASFATKRTVADIARYLAEVR
jgi:acyl transferase domain-containing protein